jgi:signal transduction histidine kinase
MAIFAAARYFAMQKKARPEWQRPYFRCRICGGGLLVSTEKDRTGVLVAVQDSGPGIDATHLERIFEAFYTTKSAGTGMGLSICQTVINGRASTAT